MRETDWGGNWLFSDGWGSSQSIIQFSVLGRAAFPSCYLTWGQIIVEVMMKIAISFKRFHACIAVLSALNPQQATFDTCLCRRLLNTHGQVWVNLLWGRGSFLLGSALHKVLFVPSVSLFPQSCVSPGGCMVWLIATSSKRTYAIPRPLPLQQSTAHLPLQETLKHSSVSVSVGSLGLGVHKICLSSLSISGGMRFDFMWFGPPTVLLELLLCPLTWGISSKSLQCCIVTAPASHSCYSSAM